MTRSDDRHYVRKVGESGYELHMVDVTFATNDFAAEDHPALYAIVEDIHAGRIKEDLTIEQFEDVEDPRITEAWEKARYVAENVACLNAAEHLVGWGQGYRSDDGYDYLTTALDEARYLSNIDLDEQAFREWWNYVPSYGPSRSANPEMSDVDHNGDYIGEGASDGEIRFALFPKRWGWDNEEV